MKEQTDSTLNSILKEVRKISPKVGTSTTTTDTNIKEVGGSPILISGTTPVLPSIILDANGGQITEFGLSANVPVAGATKATPAAIVDSAGNQITSFGSPSTNTPRYVTAANTSASDITLSTSGLGLTHAQIKAIIIVNPIAHTSQVLVQGSAGYTFQINVNVVSIYKDGVAITTLTGDDSYLVQYEGVPIGSDATNDLIKVYDKSPARYHAITHWSPVHGTATYASAVTLSTVFDFTVDDASCTIAAITVFNIDPTIAPKIYEQGINGISIRAVNDVITLYGAGAAPFTNNALETYRVAISAYPQTIDKQFDAVKGLNLNPDSAIVTYNSLYDGATTTETATTTALMTVAVDRGRVILAGSSITNAGAGYTAGAHYLLVEFNGGIGAIFSYTSTGTTLGGGTLALVSGGYGYTASGTNVNVMLCEELPTSNGGAMNNNRRLSVNGLLHSTATQSKMLMRVMATNEINTNTALTNWAAVYGADTTTSNIVKEITTTTEDKVFMLDFDDFNYGFYKILYAYEKTTGTGTQIKTKESY